MWFKKAREEEDREEGVQGVRGSGEKKEEREEEESEFEAVLFIPHTPKEELRKNIQRREDQLSQALGVRRVKVVERGGISLEHILCDKNPWSKKWCGRNECRVCRKGEGQLGKCRKEGVVYQVECGKCKEEGKRKGGV